MTDLSKLSRREREIMEIVFAGGIDGVTLTQILEQMENAPTRPALRSILGILENKGELRHSKRSREFVYFPKAARDRVGRTTFRRVVDTFFSGSIGAAVASHLNDPKARFEEKELQELIDLIDSRRNSSESTKE